MARPGDWRVLVTRPREQAEPWAERLAALGVEPLVVPLMAIEPVREPGAVQAVKQVVLDFDRYQRAIFVSRNAVAHALDWLEAYWPQFPLGVAHYAVGERTGERLSAADLTVHNLASASRGAMNSEALLAHPDLQAVAGEKIVIFRGVGGRGLLGEVLRERGARVDYCELYHRRLPEAAPAELARALGEPVQWQRPHLSVLHSGEALDNYRRVLAQLAALPATAELAEWLAGQVPLLVPGPRVAQLAQDAGFTRVWRADNAADPSMLAAVEAVIDSSPRSGDAP